VDKETVVSSVWELEEKFCNSCNHIWSQCPVKETIGRGYCPKCGGRVYEYRDDEPYQFNASAGLIPVNTEDSNYEWWYACNCEVGRWRTQHQGVVPFDFGTKQHCYRTRKMATSEFKHQKFMRTLEKKNEKDIEDNKRKKDQEE
jgi:hypothetical protein